MKKLFLFSPLILIAFWACSYSTGKEDCPNYTKTDSVVVGFYPMGKFDTALVNLLVDEVEAFYGYSVEVLSGSELPQKAYYKARNRYRADTLLDYLLEVRPSTIDFMVGLTEEDISCTNGNHPDWGVFGLGFLPGKSCVISSYRLHFGEKSKAHFQERISKVVIHELGHNFGLPHCPNSNCIMRDAEGTIKSVDAEQKALCPSCKKMLKKLLP